ncbi:alkylmercury lyase family protein [Methylobacterium fujisawaense]|uniref:alkylmercury lyase family protein n=1 Tax=Methylobacterium fujisawaense TaxID=107400 RepID=UPI00313CDE19
MSATPASGSKPVAEIRPGILRPNWSAVTTDMGRHALAGRMAARSGLLDKWLHALNPAEDQIWRGILRFYAAQGRPPKLAEIATTAGLPHKDTAVLLHKLQLQDLVGLDPSSGVITHAYPFTQSPTGHRVRLNEHAFNALCAIDALGIAEMYDTDVTIESQCRFCGVSIRVSTAEKGHGLQSSSPAQSVVWYDFAYADNAAASCCPLIAFFCSDEHLQNWLDVQKPAHAGIRLTMLEALELGRAIFGPVLREKC